MDTSSTYNVLVFDSGVGGLSVFQEMQARLPNLNYVYVFDNKAYPYGELSPETLLERVSHIVEYHVKVHHIDLVVVACNTASTIVLPKLRKQLTIPIVGVVPAIKPASLLSNESVALIATPATITREYTKDLIRDFSDGKTVEMLGSTQLVDMAEAKLRGEAVDMQALSQLLRPICDQVDVAVLGCTHFPLIRQEIKQVLGEGVILVDSGEAIARRVKALIQQLEATTKPMVRPHLIYSTAPTWQEGALNESLHELGFSPVQISPLQDV